MSKQSDDKFYIMASTGAHIGEALESISQPRHESQLRTPLKHFVKAVVSSLSLFVSAVKSLFIKKSK